MKASHRPPREGATVDMSSEAIDRRMRELGQLYRLGIEVAKARPLGRLGARPRDSAAREPSGEGRSR